MIRLLDKIKNIYNTFGLYIFSNNILCSKSNNIELYDNKYITILQKGDYYIHIYDNNKLIYININNIKTQLKTINILQLEENDILNKYNNDYFNMLICRNN
jgi:hypothetical protein